MTRLVLSALLAVLALFGAAPQALAHTDLVASDPAAGASVPQRPTRLTLTFSEPVPAESATVTVTGPDGSGWPLGEVVASGSTLTVEMRETGSPAGAYTVAWRVESLDGDFVDGTFAFTLTAPPVTRAPAVTPPPTAPAVTSTDGSAPTATSPGSAATITAVSTDTSTSAATVRTDDGPPLWVWILIVAVLSVVGIMVVVGLSRRGAGADDAGDGEKPAE